MTYYDDIIELIRQGEIKSKEEIHKAKVTLCKKYKMDHLPSDVDILEHASPDIYDEIEPYLRLKPMRTSSGVAVVAVMTSPHDCPHGKCMYCPGGKDFGTAQSYTGHEPAALRAQSNEFDPYNQTLSRIEQLGTIGHRTDKIDLIIMGGTFTARERDYQDWFVKRCFDAMNQTEASGLEDAHNLNEFAPSRCIGMTLETRPDWCKEEHIDQMLRLGGTRVELGVQTTYNHILADVKRGHGFEDTTEATQLAKDSGIKVCYHMMPGLPGADFDKDLASFHSLFEDEDFKPDMLKIYPTLVVEGTGLYDLWEKGDYKPYNTEENAHLIAQIKTFIPEWVRIQRIQRDIPVKLIADGVDKSNLRQIIHDRLLSMGENCDCIRCREVGLRSFKGTEPDIDSIDLKKIEYEASEGTEHFLSYEDSKNTLIGYARLRKPSVKAHRNEIREKSCMILRELKVAGEVVPIGKTQANLWQHRGYGQKLLLECEKIALEKGAESLLILSGIGVRNYYRKLGYERDGPYMAKKIV
jgi:elongator complex protein 3